MRIIRKTDIAFAIFLIIVIIFLFVAPLIVLPRVYGTQNIWNKELPESTVFLELWEIDTFEGGSASRARFLEKTAFKFQELNNNIYIFVRNLNLQQAEQMLSAGQKPDMVSFGIGSGELLLPYCKVLDIKTSARVETQHSGQVDNVQYAMPWCMGGYLLSTFSGAIDLDNLQDYKYGGKDLIGYGGEYNIPNLALPNIDEYNVNPTQYKAYEKFLEDEEFEVLLGTQRDYYKLQNKVNLGVIPECKYKYLNTFTDIVQYLSITTNDISIQNCAKNFIRYVCSVTNQRNLTSIGMFSISSLHIYENEYIDYENTILQIKNIQNVFTNNAKLNDLRNGASNE